MFRLMSITEHESNEDIEVSDKSSKGLIPKCPKIFYQKISRFTAYQMIGVICLHQ